MPISKPEQDEPASANINIKVTEDERWAFKEFCVRHRMSQVEAFRAAFALLCAAHDQKNDQRSDGA